MGIKRKIISVALCLIMMLSCINVNVIDANAAETVTFSWKNSTTYNYNIEGSVRTSFGNSGYTTIFKVGDTAQKVAGSNEGKATIDGVSLKTEYVSKNGGTYAGITYTVENTNTTSRKIYLGEGLDVQIGTNDKAPVTVLDNNRGFYMSDSGHIFNVLLRDTYGTTNVTGFWVGKFSEYSTYRSSNNFFVAQEESFDNGDSAAFWYWEYTLEPGEVKEFSHLIGVGELNNPPTVTNVTGIGTNYCTGDIINISGTVGDKDTDDTVTVKYSFDNGEEKTLAENIATNGGTKTFSGKVTVPTIDSGTHTLSVYAIDNNGNMSSAVTKTFSAHTIPDTYIYKTSNGIENGIRYKQCTNCQEIIDKQYLLTLDKGKGVTSVTGGGYYAEGKKIVVSANIVEGSTFKGWTGSSLTAAEAIYTMPSNAVKLTAEIEPFKNVYKHYAWGFKNSEGNNSTKDAFLLQTTYGEENYSEEFAPDASYALTVPNGYYLQTKFINSQITGTSQAFNFGTKITQPNYVMNFEYDYYPTSYTITYNMDGGTNNSNNPSTYNVLYGVTFGTPTKKGYDFVGWYDSNGNKITGINEGCNATFSDTADMYSKLKNRTTGDVSVTAKWTQHNYTISYNLNSGSASNKTSYTIETDTFTLNNPTRNGYTFTGWTGSNGTTAQTSVSIAKGSTGDKTYTANWTPTNYTISYNLNGGTASNKTSYNIETDTFTLNNPTKTGYTFVGWTGSNGSTAQKSVSISKGSTGNKSYTAVFQKNVYTITTKNTGSGVLSDSSKIEYADNTSVFIVPAEGYTTSSLKIDGVTINPVTKYNFLNVEKDHTVEATFTITQNKKMELIQKGYSWIDLKL